MTEGSEKNLKSARSNYDTNFQFEERVLLNPNPTRPEPEFIVSPKNQDYAVKENIPQMEDSGYKFRLKLFTNKPISMSDHILRSQIRNFLALLAFQHAFYLAVFIATLFVPYSHYVFTEYYPLIVLSGFAIFYSLILVFYSATENFFICFTNFFLFLIFSSIVFCFLTYSFGIIPFTSATIFIFFGAMALYFCTFCRNISIKILYLYFFIQTAIFIILELIFAEISVTFSYIYGIIIGIYAYYFIYSMPFIRNEDHPLKYSFSVFIFFYIEIVCVNFDIISYFFK